MQSRMLNKGKGPAVHSLRAQIDRRAYSKIMKHKLELQKGLELKQGEIVDLRLENGFWKAVTRLSAIYTAQTVILATGTFLGGKIFVGDTSSVSYTHLKFVLPSIRQRRVLWNGCRLQQRRRFARLPQ